MMNFENKSLRNHGMLGNNEITRQKSLRVTRVLLDLQRTGVIQSTYFWLVVSLSRNTFKTIYEGVPSDVDVSAKELLQ